MVSFGLEFGDDDERDHDHMFDEPEESSWIREQHRGVEHVGLPLGRRERRPSDTQSPLMVVYWMVGLGLRGGSVARQDQVQSVWYIGRAGFFAWNICVNFARTVGLRSGNGSSPSYA